MNQDIFVHKDFLCFICMQPFNVTPTHIFINEAPGQTSICTVPLQVTYTAPENVLHDGA